jgi:predicted dehydrogenase
MALSVVMPISIALLGCGHPHLSDLLGVIAAEPDLRLAAAWDADRSAVPGVISSYAVSDAERAIRLADAVVISAATDQRPGLCVRAAQAGRPVLIEKPIARSAKEALALGREVARTRTPAVPALFLRELPALQRLEGVLRAGLLGRLSAASASYLHAGALDGAFLGPIAWMRDPARAGVGALGDLAIHLVDAFAMLGELPRLLAVSLDRDGAGRGDVGGSALGRWRDVPITLRASWVTRPAGLELSISGARATAVLRDGSLELISDTGAGERWIGAPPDAGNALRAFAARLRARRFARDGLAPAIRAQEALERAVVLD